jgi:hypothetical protein
VGLKTNVAGEEAGMTVRVLVDFFDVVLSATTSVIFRKPAPV